jgi:hypothetical protein
MNKIELKAKLELFQREATALARIKTDCSQCEHGMRRGLCGLYNAPVPPDVARVGCDAWVYNEVPF